MYLCIRVYNVKWKFENELLQGRKMDRMDKLYKDALSFDIELCHEKISLLNLQTQRYRSAVQICRLSIAFGCVD